MAQETATPEAVITAATTTVKGDLGGLILLGTFGTGDAPKALIRTAEGEVVTLQPGDKIGRDPVIAIEDGRIALNKSGTTNWLTQPAVD
ncbi:amidophosphoribosyltransferase [Antarctobacter jejuensis]|uniref:amidophosphoribosyltransferase n=1 Tax=Antarctobacter jejuensis TaxID=1439938 RepID=UPI003FD54A29